MTSAAKITAVIGLTHMFVEHRAYQFQKWYRHFFVYIITSFNLTICILNEGQSFYIISIIIYVRLYRTPSIFELYQPLLTLRSPSKTQLFVAIFAQPLNHTPEKQIIGIQVLILCIKSAKFIHGLRAKSEENSPSNISPLMGDQYHKSKMLGDDVFLDFLD